MDDEQELPLGPFSNNPSLSILDLADELILNILRFLDYTSLVQCARSCKKLSQVSKDWRLYREVNGDVNTSNEFVQWFIDRTLDPKRLKCDDNYRMLVLIKPKLSMWLNLRVLHLDRVDLRGVEERPLDLPQKQLRILKLKLCIVHHDTIAQLLKNNHKLCRLKLCMNWCACLKGNGCYVIPLGYLVNSKESLQEVSLCTSGRALLNLTCLGDCHNLKQFTLQQEGPYWRYYDNKLAQDIERVVRNCNKLEEVEFKCTTFITDQFLEIMFENCPKLKRLKLDTLALISEKSCLTAIRVLEHLENLAVLGCPQISKKSEASLKIATQGTRVELDVMNVRF